MHTQLLLPERCKEFRSPFPDAIETTTVQAPLQKESSDKALLREEESHSFRASESLECRYWGINE